MITKCLTQTMTVKSLLGISCFICVCMTPVGTYAAQNNAQAPAKQSLDNLMAAYKKLDCDTVLRDGIELAKAGVPKAQLLVGLCAMRFGKGPSYAMPWFEKAALNGEARAAKEVGFYYAMEGSKNNDDAMLRKACKFLKIGKDGNDPLAENYHMAFHCKDME